MTGEARDKPGGNNVLTNANGAKFVRGRKVRDVYYRNVVLIELVEVDGNESGVDGIGCVLHPDGLVVYEKRNSYEFNTSRIVN